MTVIEQPEPPTVGDVIVVSGHTVGATRTLGEILEVLGDPGHERFRVRWEDGHESIFHPAEGEATIHHFSPRGASVEVMRALRAAEVDFEPRRHPRTTTALDESRTLELPPAEVGKTVVVVTPEGMVRVVIPASERLSLAKLREALDAGEIRLATEDELAAAYPAFELGAVPPFGGPSGERVVVDSRIAGLETVVVEAGSHSDSVRLASADLVRFTSATVADVSDD